MSTRVAAKIMGHSDELLGQVEAPQGVASIYAVSMVSLPSNWFGLESSSGSGVWDPDGELIWWSAATKALEWDGESLLCAENAFDPIQQDAHADFSTSHRIVCRSINTFEAVDSRDVPVRMGGIEHLVLGGEHLACVWIEQTEWGVTFLASRGHGTVSGSAHVPHRWAGRPTWYNGRLFGVSRFGSVWWCPDGDWGEPSIGGAHVVGWMSELDPESRGVPRESPIVVELETGWIPDDPETPDINTVWGVENDGDQLRFWLPDGSAELVSVPLSPELRVKRGIARRRVVS